VSSILSHKDSHIPKGFLILSYDIACQYSKNFLDRLNALPECIRPLITDWTLKFVVPKFHIRGHIIACQEEFSYNFMPSAAMTDGEGIERFWSAIGGVAYSTAQMGPGARHEFLNDLIGAANFVKLCDLGKVLNVYLDCY